MLSWLRRHVQPSLPAGWIQIAPTLYQLRHGDEAIQVEVKRLRASKRATARAHGQGIVVCVPLRFSDASLKVALAGFEPWIVAQWAKSHAFAHPLLQPFVTESLPLFGEAMPVVWSEASRIAVSVVDGSLHVAAPRAVSAKQMGAALKQFYEAQAREVMAPILNRLAPSMPSMPVRIRFKRVRSIWGSMNSKGVLTLEYSLAIAPRYVFEYLIVHELCHLIEMNHSRAFWRHVAQRCPEFHHAEEYLKARGNLVRLDFDRITEPDRFIWLGDVD